MAAPWITVSCWWPFCWLWTSQNLTLQQNSLRRNWMPVHFCGLLAHVTVTPPWLLRTLLVSTSSELYPEYFWLPTFLDCLGIQFFSSLSFPTQSVKLILVTYSSLCSTCVTYRTPCHASDHHLLPNQPLPREAEDFPRGEKYFKHVSLLTYLIYFSPKGVYMAGSIYVLRSPHRTLISFSLVLNQRFKSPICW